MNKLKKLAILASFLMITSLSYGQIVAWQFALPEPTDGRDNTLTATTIDENLEKSTLTRGPGAQKKAGNSRAFGANLVACETYEDAKAAGAYFQFTVKAKKGYEFSLRSLNTIIRRQVDAANTYRWAYSLDGKNFTEIGPDNVVMTSDKNVGERQPNIDLKGYSDLQKVPANKTLTFRIYAWGGTTNTGKAINFGIGKSGSKGNNALALFGSVSKSE